MRVLVLDVWQDLREKRLWPVALALVVALVAVPVVLLAGGEPAPAAPTPQPARAEGDVVVTLAGAEEATGQGSALEAFSPADPFSRRPADAPPAASDTSDAPAPASPAPAPSATVPSTPVPIPTPSAPAAPTPSPPAASSGEDAADPERYTDTVDVTFGRRGSERPRRGIARLDPLPASGTPVALFLGSTVSGRSAVFLLGAGLETRGDGSCAPSRARCTYLTLRPDRRHDQAFLEDGQGRKWSLRLDALERVPLDEAVAPPEDTPALGSTVEDR